MTRESLLERRLADAEATIERQRQAILFALENPHRPGEAETRLREALSVSDRDKP